jgi:flavin reductase (DIM6/NTAB) family NADH-FMN oxidoreductase RutF
VTGEQRDEDGPDTDVLRPDAASFRAVLGHFATGITVITAMDDGEPVGIAANSFTSVSLEPPLVLFCAAKTSSTWPRIRHAGHFTVNVLDEHQEHISRLFAQKGADRFGQIQWSVGEHGPILDDVHAYLDCTIEAEHDAGDHVIVVGRVVELGYASEGKPLLFYRGGYGHFES